MPNYGTMAVCPFFDTEDAITIKCEGIIQSNQADATYHFRFANKIKKKEWLQKYCEKHTYLTCPYAALVNSSYDESGKSLRALVKNPSPSYIRAPVQRAKVKKSKDIKGQLSFRF